MTANRRSFVSGAVGLGVGTWALVGCRERAGASGVKDVAAETKDQRVAEAGAGSLRTRRSVSSLDPNGPELNDYRTAIRAMAALDAADHRSWEGQANIHNDSCPHGSWFFLPWHRTYLVWFERLIQKFSGNPSWALPYWDWTTTPRIPPAFADQKGDNPLFHPRDAQGDLDAAIVGPGVIARLMGLNDLIAFGGSRGRQQRTAASAGMLEGTPHNGVHNYCGGDMGTFVSPRDPIFWLHHANVDRIWTEWAGQHPDAALPGNPTAPRDRNLTQAFWLSFSMTGYFDLDNNPVTATPNDTLTTTGYGYQYDTALAQEGQALRLADGRGAPATETSVLTMVVESSRITRSNPFVTFSLPVTSAMRSAFADYRRATRAAESTCVRLYAEGIPVPDDRSQAFRMFLNHPSLTTTTPDGDDHFVGRYAFFGPPHAQHGGVTRSVVFDLKRTFDKQFTAVDQLGQELAFQVQLFSSPDAAMPPPSVFAGITLTLEFSRVG